ncbi:MAG: hypothetical protein WCG27_12020, partial [Pseudomonadota bacterium]
LALDKFRDLPITPQILVPTPIYSMSEEAFSQFESSLSASVNFIHGLTADPKTNYESFGFDSNTGKYNFGIANSHWGNAQLDVMLNNAKRRNKISYQKQVMVTINNGRGSNFTTDSSTYYRDNVVGTDKESTGINGTIGNATINGNPNYVDGNGAPLTVRISNFSLNFSVPVISDFLLNSIGNSTSSTNSANSNSKLLHIVELKKYQFDSLDLKNNTSRVIVGELDSQGLLSNHNANLFTKDNRQLSFKGKYLIVLKAQILSPEVVLQMTEERNTIQNLIKPVEDEMELTDEGLAKLESAKSRDDLVSFLSSITVINKNEVVSENRLKSMALRFDPKKLRKEFAKTWVDITFDKSGLGTPTRQVTKRLEHLTITPWSIDDLLEGIKIPVQSVLASGKEKNRVINVSIVINKVMGGQKKFSFMGEKEKNPELIFQLYFIPTVSGGTLEIVPGSKIISKIHYD